MPDDARAQRSAKIPARLISTAFTDEDFTKDHDWIKRNLAHEMYTTAFNVDEADAMFERTDPEVAKAAELMPKARALSENARRVVAQRMASRGQQ